MQKYIYHHNVKLRLQYNQLGGFSCQNLTNYLHWSPQIMGALSYAHTLGRAPIVGAVPWPMIMASIIH